MGELTTIGFKPGRSPLHRLDPRTKQILLIGLSLTSLRGNITFLSISSLLTIYLFTKAKLRIWRLICETRYFLFFLLFIFIVRTVTFTGQWLPAIVSADMIGEALIVCWRLLIVVFMGLLLMSTTRIADIRAALIWLMKPLPLVNEKAAATMVGLVVRFLPLILYQAGEIGDAMRARGIEKRKNPLTRLVKFTIALFRRIFLRADELVEAMQARCYNENRIVADLAFSKRDSYAAVIGILLCLSVLLE